MSELMMVLLAFILFIVILILLSGIRVIKEWEKIPVLRLGRYVGLRGPGLTYVIPVIERVPQRVSLRIQVFPFRTERTLTVDNVPVNVDAVMFWKVVDPEKCILNVEDYVQATQWAAQTTLREILGKVELNELLSEREKIGMHVRDIIDQKTEAWGVKVLSVEIRDVIIPPALEDAMSRQAQAERERMARVTLAKAEEEAAQKFLEAAKIYEADPNALTLRWMNILYEIGRMPGANTLIFIPSNLPVAGPIGLVGITQPRQGKGKRSES